jgi:formate dehydrogenase alpha subunit
MSTVVKKTINFTLNGEPVTAPEGTVILDAAKQKGVFITNLCSNPKLKPFAACRTCMVETVVDGKKELVYSCTHPVAEGMEVTTTTEETDRYNKACLEMLLVEHPLDCPICDKSGVCPLQDNTDALSLYNGRFEIQRRNEPSIKSNPLIEFYLNRCIMCGMCVRICDEIQGVQALDYHKRGYKIKIGTANEEPLDCEFCGQCITVCPTGALMDLSSEARGLAAMFTDTETTCNFCSWGCTIKLETKKGKLIRIEGDETLGVGINEGNLCAKGRFGHGMVQNKKRLQTPMMNVGGEFKEISWDEAIQIIAERITTTVNRSGPESVAAVGGETLTNEENYLLQKLFRGVIGSNQVTNLNHVRAPYINAFQQKCIEGGIVSKPITELAEADVVLMFNTDIPSEYPVAGNSIRKGAIYTGTDVLIANPRNVEFKHESRTEVRMTYKPETDATIANRISKILIDNNLVDTAKTKEAIPNYEDFVSSLAKYTGTYTEELTGVNDAELTLAAERLGRNADRFILIGNDIIDTGQGEAILNALLNLSLLLHHGGEGSVNIYPPREHCNSQGVNDMGMVPDYLPGYRPLNDAKAISRLSSSWGTGKLDKLLQKDMVADLWSNCSQGAIKLLMIAGENPCHSSNRPSTVKEALRTVPFLVVQDMYMTETASLADIVLPTCSYAEKEGTFTNLSRHVQRVAPAVLPEGESRPDFEIFHDLAQALDKPFTHSTPSEVQEEIVKIAPCYKDTFPGKKSAQWKPEESGHKPEFAPTIETTIEASPQGYPMKLISNNHMFHIGSYTHYAKALVDIGPSCVAEISHEDSEAMDIKSGDLIRIKSEMGFLDIPVAVTDRTTQGVVYVPKNWVDVPVNKLRNGDRGLIPVRINKQG